MTTVLLSVLGLVGRFLRTAMIIILPIVLLVLFFPISYKADIVKKEEKISLCVSISWLFRFIHARFELDKDKESSRFDKDIRIAGLSIPRILKKIRKKKTKSTEEKTGRKIRREASKKPSVPPGGKREIPEGTKPLPVEVVKARHPGFLARLGARISAFIGKLKKLMAKAGKIADLLADWLSYMGTESFKSAMDTLLHEGGAILRHILPKKPEGYVRFGTDDPARTGMILGIVAMLYPAIPEKLTIEPDFLNSVLDMDLKTGGHFFVIVLLVRAIRILKNRDVRILIRRILKKDNKKAKKTDKPRKGRSGTWAKTKKTQRFRTT